MFDLSKKFRFEASHLLPNHDGKCSRLHGHSYKMIVRVRGNSLHTTGAKAGMVMDLGDLAEAVKPLIDSSLDHWHLNDSTGLENPTSEELARWVFDELEPLIPLLHSVKISETCTSSCTYKNPRRTK